MGKKFGFADKLDIPYSIVVGPDEIKKNQYALRDMKTGGETKLIINGRVVDKFKIKF